MAWQFTCPLCKNKLSVLKSDINKQANCPECKTWVSIPQELFKSNIIPNCQIRNSQLSKPQDGTAQSEKVEIKVKYNEQNMDYQSENSTDIDKIKKVLGDNPQLKIAIKPITIKQYLISILKTIPVTSALLLLNIIVFINMIFAGNHPLTPNLLFLFKNSANFFSVLFDGEIFRLFTSIFIHSGIIHFGLNMWALWVFGNSGENLFGSLSFGIIFFFSGLSSSLCGIYLNNFISINASGAIFGLSGALLALFIFKKSIFSQALRLSIIRHLLIFTGIIILLGIYYPNIDNAAHICAFITGFFLGTLFKNQEKTPISIKSIFIIIIIIVSTIIIYTTTNSLAKNWKMDQLVHKNPQLMKIIESNLKDEKTQKNIAYLHLKSIIYWELQDIDKYNQTMKEIKRLNPEDLIALHSEAERYLLEKKNDKAREIYKKIIKLDSKNFKAIGNLGWIYYLENNFSKSIEYSQMAYKMEPTAYYTRFNEALSLLRLNKIQKSQEKYQKALEILGNDNPSNTKSEAIEDLKKLIQHGIMEKEAKSILEEIFQLQYTHY